MDGLALREHEQSERRWGEWEGGEGKGCGKLCEEADENAEEGCGSVMTLSIVVAEERKQARRERSSLLF